MASPQCNELRAFADAWFEKWEEFWRKQLPEARPRCYWWCTTHTNGRRQLVFEAQLGPVRAAAQQWADFAVCFPGWKLFEHAYKCRPKIKWEHRATLMLL